MPRFYSQSYGRKPTDAIPPCRVIYGHGREIPLDDIAWLDSDSKECGLLSRDASGAVVYEKDIKAVDYGMARVRTVLKGVMIIWQGGVPEEILDPGSQATSTILQNTWDNNWPSLPVVLEKERKSPEYGISGQQLPISGVLADDPTVPEEAEEFSDEEREKLGEYLEKCLGKDTLMRMLPGVRMLCANSKPPAKPIRIYICKDSKPQALQSARDELTAKVLRPLLGSLIQDGILPDRPFTIEWKL